jgi:lipopolysaccharide transport system ATP-binding protein
MGTITVPHLGKAYKQYPTRWSRLVQCLPGEMAEQSASLPLYRTLVFCTRIKNDRSEI